MKENYMDNKLFNQIVNYLIDTNDTDVQADDSMKVEANKVLIKRAVSEFKNFNSQYCFYDCTIAHIAAIIEDELLIELIARKAPEIFKIKDNMGKTPADYVAENMTKDESLDDDRSLYTILNVAPETFPQALCRISEFSNAQLVGLFNGFNRAMKEKNDGSPEYIKKCADKIVELNKIIKQKTEEYKAIEESDKMIDKIVPLNDTKTLNTHNTKTLNTLQKN